MLKIKKTFICHQNCFYSYVYCSADTYFSIEKLFKFI